MSKPLTRSHLYFYAHRGEFIDFNKLRAESYTFGRENQGIDSPFLHRVNPIAATLMMQLVDIMPNSISQSKAAEKLIVGELTGIDRKISSDYVKENIGWLRQDKLTYGTPYSYSLRYAHIAPTLSGIQTAHEVARGILDDEEYKHANGRNLATRVKVFSGTTLIQITSLKRKINSGLE